MDTEHVGQNIQRIVLEVAELGSECISLGLSKVEPLNPVTKKVESDHFDQSFLENFDVGRHQDAQKWQVCDQLE